MTAETTLPIAPGLVAHASGALWLPEIATAIVADLHLGYSWAQRRRGELGPLVDERTREKLRAFRNDLCPKAVVFLGDVVHSPRPCRPEREWIEEVLGELASSARLIAIRGNHDRRFASEFAHLGLEFADTWSYGRYTMAHGDRWTFAWPEDHALIIGHLHPALPVYDASGAGHRLPIFLVGTGCVILPAFSPFARGYDVTSGLPPELERCYAAAPPEAYAATGKRIVRLGHLQNVLDANNDVSRGQPRHFRRRSGNAPSAKNAPTS